MKYAIIVKTSRGYENVNMAEKLMGIRFSKIWLAGDIPLAIEDRVRMIAAPNGAEVVRIS